MNEIFDQKKKKKLRVVQFVVLSTLDFSVFRAFIDEIEVECFPFL